MTGSGIPIKAGQAIAGSPEQPTCRRPRVCSWQRRCRHRQLRPRPAGELQACWMLAAGSITRDASQTEPSPSLTAAACRLTAPLASCPRLAGLTLHRSPGEQRSWCSPPPRRQFAAASSLLPECSVSLLAVVSTLHSGCCGDKAAALTALPVSMALLLQPAQRHAAPGMAAVPRAPPRRRLLRRPPMRHPGSASCRWAPAGR